MPTTATTHDTADLQPSHCVAAVDNTSVAKRKHPCDRKTASASVSAGKYTLEGLCAVVKDTAQWIESTSNTVSTLPTTDHVAPPKLWCSMPHGQGTQVPMGDSTHEAGCENVRTEGHVHTSVATAVA
jgi:hypothetical protein